MIFKPTKENAIFSKDLLEYYFYNLVLAIIAIIRNRHLIPLINNNDALILVQELNGDIILKKSRENFKAL